MSRLVYGLAIAAGIIALDQATKWWILLSVMQPPRVIELTPFFNLVLTWNRGVSFGMFDTDSSAGPWILSAVAIAVVVVLAVWLTRGPSRFVASGLGLIVGGAIGNVIDRFAHGAVVDFLDIHWAGYHWPAFNVADSAITIGAAILVLDSLFAGRSRKVKMPESQ
jgi:signal peptidase II